ncbi:MAG: hypothetical protein JO066_13090 [Verrucomicrobia bacterium]|nr:hypothetical protein [Verrucomicrobiota bacterium]
MKRLIAGGLVLLLVAIGIFLWGQHRQSLLASQLAPADCLLYVEMPDLLQSARRWPDTALSRILGEPSVQHFLRQPISNAPANFQNAWVSFAALQCSALFFGVTDPDRACWICGLQTAVEQSRWRREIANISKALFGQNIKEFPAEKLGQEETQDEAQMSCVRAGNWILLSRSKELLVQAVRNSRTTSGGLRSLNLFKQCQANVPAGYDLLSFAQGEPSLDPSVGLHWRFREQATQASTRAVLAATTMMGTRLRDTVFILNGAAADGSRLDRKGLAMTSSSTIGYLASHVGFAEIWRWCGQLSKESSFAETVRRYMGEAKSFGIEPRDLDTVVSGAEIIVDRDPKTDSLNGAISLEVLDPAKFENLMDQVVAEKFPDSCRRVQVASVPAYLMRVNERVSIVFGLVGRQMLISGSELNFAEFVHRLQNHAPGLEANNQYEAIVKLVGKPSDLFAYLDAKSGFERFYDASRPMLAFGIVLMPNLNRYVDAMALPETIDISKHLGPIVLSRHRVPNGVVDESIGPITAYDAVALILGSGLAMGFWER